MSREEKTEKIKKLSEGLSCLINDKKLIESMKCLLDSKVLEVVYPPVEAKLFYTHADDEHPTIHIGDKIRGFSFHTNFVEDFMLQDITKAYSKYRPEKKEEEELHPIEKDILAMMVDFVKRDENI